MASDNVDAVAAEAYERAREIRENARRDLGLPEDARVPGEVEKVCITVLKGAGWKFTGERWELPDAVAIR